LISPNFEINISDIIEFAHSLTILKYALESETNSIQTRKSIFHSGMTKFSKKSKVLDKFSMSKSMFLIRSLSEEQLGSKSAAVANFMSQLYGTNCPRSLSMELKSYCDGIKSPLKSIEVIPQMLIPPNKISPQLIPNTRNYIMAFSRHYLDFPCLSQTLEIFFIAQDKN